MSREPIRILLVEDDDDHAELALRGMRAHSISHVVTRIADGESALDYLFRRGPFVHPTASPRPHVVLLDLRLPRIDGLDVLRAIKGSDELARIPVIILTTSDKESDVTRANDLHADAYLVKPAGYGRFVELMHELGLTRPAWEDQKAGGKAG